MKRILLVEDNELNRDMLGRRLSRNGFDVIYAADGQAGVDAARDDCPDLILLDMSLPVIDGWQAAHQLKQMPETAGIPIIALTAHAMAGEREKALAAGCDDFDTKPVDFPRLTERIEHWLGEQKHPGNGEDNR